jgi:hypothetical protein
MTPPSKEEKRIGEDTDSDTKKKMLFLLTDSDNNSYMSTNLVFRSAAGDFRGRPIEAMAATYQTIHSPLLE